MMFKVMLTNFLYSKYKCINFYKQKWIFINLSSRKFFNFLLCFLKFLGGRNDTLERVYM